MPHVQTLIIPLEYGVLIPLFRKKTLSSHKRSVYDIVKLANGKLASACVDGKIKIWNIEKATCEKFFAIDGFGQVLVELPDDKLICGAFNQIIIWDLQKPHGQNVLRLSEIINVQAIIILHDKQIAVSSHKNIRIYDTFGSKRPRMVLRGHSNPVSGLLSVSDGQFLLSWSSSDYLIMWNLKCGARVRTFHEVSGAETKMLFKPNIVVVADGSRIRFWNIYTGACEKNVNCKGGRKIAMNQNGQLIVYGSGREIQFWGN